MARVIQVTPEYLETAAGKIEGLAADYKAQYDALYQETGALAATYSGKDYNDFEKMKTLMLNYADFLRKSARTYRNTQDTVTAEAKKLVN